MKFCRKLYPLKGRCVLANHLSYLNVNCYKLTLSNGTLYFLVNCRKVMSRNGNENSVISRTERIPFCQLKHFFNQGHTPYTEIYCTSIISKLSPQFPISKLISAKLFKKIVDTVQGEFWMRIWRKEQLIFRQLTTITELLLANIAV